jgi:hypothetical protein
LRGLQHRVLTHASPPPCTGRTAESRETQSSVAHRPRWGAGHVGTGSAAGHRQAFGRLAASPWRPRSPGFRGAAGTPRCEHFARGENCGRAQVARTSNRTRCTGLATISLPAAGASFSSPPPSPNAPAISGSNCSGRGRAQLQRRAKSKARAW